METAFYGSRDRSLGSIYGALEETIKIQIISDLEKSS